MSNTDTSTGLTVNHCKGCAVLLTDENWGWQIFVDECNRCDKRLPLDDELLEIAFVANKLFSGLETVDALRHDKGALHVRLRELKRPIEDGGDPRLAHIWSTLWDALDGDVERNETWGLFINAIAGDVPDYRTKTYSGTITLTFDFDDLELPGTLADYEIEEAIINELSGDLRQGYEDGVVVDYDEQ
jgi:hypothetical protein